MSGTPSISEVYAVTGGHRLAGLFDPPVSLVVLSRGPRLFRSQVLAEFQQLGFSEILLVEDGREHGDSHELQDQIPELRLLIPLEPQSPGTRINEAAREVTTGKFLVIWDDQSLDPSMVRAQSWNRSADVATVPEMQDSQGRGLPSVAVPGLDGDRLKILALGSDLESVDTLFPLDYTALYDREKFLRTGGFDAVLAPFWQKVDWGLRSRLWGETLSRLKSFRVSYRSPPPVDDQTPDRTYPRFYLRNLAVRHDGDHGVLPFTRFWTHARRTGLSLSRSLEQFLSERRWVQKHRYRFQTDIRLLTELWGTT